MKKKSLALLILAVGCGLFAALGINQVLARRGDSSVPSDTTQIYVAKVDLAAGSLIPQENLKLEQWPKDRIPAGALTRPEDIEGRRARHKIYAGEPLIEPKLLGRGQVPTDSLVPKGLRVVAVTVTMEAIHSGLVLPGARCDVQVYVHPESSMGISEPICKTILQDIRVFAVNDVTSTESVDPKGPETKSIPTGKTVSLLVTPAQAQIVTLASQLGTIRLVLRSGDDNEQPKTSVVTAHELLGVSGGGDRNKERPAAADDKRFQEWAEMIKQAMRENAKAAPAKPRETDDSQRFTMRVRCGSDVNDVLMTNNSSVRGLPGDEGTWTVSGLGALIRNRPNAEASSPKPAESGPPAQPVNLNNLKSQLESMLPAKAANARPPGT